MKIEITNQEKWQHSLTLKLGLLAVIGLFLMIPLEIIKEIINERQQNADKVKKEISDQWALKQTVSGPVLNIPVRTIPAGKDEVPKTLVWHILPEKLDISGKIDPEIRYRSIYKTVVYRSGIQLSGYFTIPGNSATSEYDVLWDQAYYTVGITDNRGLNGDIRMKAGNRELEAEPGLRDQDLFLSGISFAGAGAEPSARVDFSITLNLSGSEGLLLSPLGKTTTADLRSDWPAPSFSGSFLPAKREISEKGFTASWQVTHLNRNYPQQWTGSSFRPQESAFGLDLFMQVDHYQKSVRSAKYGILFIALTFLVLIFLETTRKESIHVIHYFLVALALVLFFSLLNSLSEQTGFNAAYLVSSAATILLISYFTGTLLKSMKAALAVSGMLAVLYTFIFILLTLNDYSYLAGNIGLFALLAAIMGISAKYNLFRREVPPHTENN